MVIDSKDNKLVKYVKRLQDNKFANKECKTLVESPKIVAELMQAGIVDTILVSANYPRLEEVISGPSKVVQISDRISKYIAQTETSTNIFAIVNLSISKHTIGNKILILDTIQDPNNYGAICRNAAAFGFDTILDINCCFAYSNKVTRCSMGNNFKLNIIKSSYSDVERIKKEENLQIFCCDMNGKDIKKTRPKCDKFAIIIGNEGNGVADDLVSIADETISIPMQNDVESLNASVSAGIIMYMLS